MSKSRWNQENPLVTEGLAFEGFFDAISFSANVEKHSTRKHCGRTRTACLCWPDRMCFNGPQISVMGGPQLNKYFETLTSLDQHVSPTGGPCTVVSHVSGGRLEWGTLCPMAWGGQAIVGDPVSHVPGGGSGYSGGPCVPCPGRGVRL